MADTPLDDATDAKISQLPDGGLPTLGDKLPMARSGLNYNVDGSQIANSAALDQLRMDLQSATQISDAAYAQASAVSSIAPRLDAAYSRANAAYGLAQTAQGQAQAQANQNLALAQAAYNLANATLANAATADADAFRAWDQANSALAAANTAKADAASAWATANAAYAQSGSNGAFTLAQTAYNRANSATTTASSAQATGQTAYAIANTAIVAAAQAQSTANATLVIAGPAFDQANAAYAQAQQAYAQGGQGTNTTVIANGVGAVPRLLDYIFNGTNFNDQCTASNGGINGDTPGIEDVVAPSGDFWLRTSGTADYTGKAGTNGTWATTDMSGASTNKFNVVANLAVGTALNAAVFSQGITQSVAQSQAGIVNHGGTAGQSSNTSIPGSVYVAKSTPVCKLFQPNMLHSIGASVSILVPANTFQSRVIMGFNTYTRQTIKESGVWFEALYTETTWRFVYTPGYGSTTNNLHTRVRVDTGISIQYSSGNTFTRLRIDWDGPNGLCTGYINEAQVAQIPSAKMPTNCPYSQGVVGVDLRANMSTDVNTVTPRSGAPANNTAFIGPVAMAGYMDFVAYYPGLRSGW